MNASKFLVSTATAIAVIGGASFAYAQSTTPATGTTTDPQAQSTAPTTSGTMPADANSTMNRDSTGTTHRMNDTNKMRSNDPTGATGTAPSYDSHASTERPARAARN